MLHSRAAHVLWVTSQLGTSPNCTNPRRPVQLAVVVLIRRSGLQLYASYRVHSRDYIDNIKPKTLVTLRPERSHETLALTFPKIMQTRRRKCQKTNTRVFLLDLPDGAVESLASFLQPVAMAQLQSTCRHLRSLLSQDRYSRLLACCTAEAVPIPLCMHTTCFAAAFRLWHIQLEQSYPFWTSAGIYPVRGRKDGETWKQLVCTAYGTKVPGPETMVITSNHHKMIKDIWDKGQHALSWKASHQQSNRSAINRRA